MNIILITVIGIKNLKNNSRQTSISPSPTLVILSPTIAPSLTPFITAHQSLKTCSVDADCFLTTLGDCLSDRYGCGVNDYAQDTVEAFNNRLCTKKNPGGPVPGCQAEELHKKEYVTKCINNLCIKTRIQITFTQQKRSCRDENDCAGSPCVNGYCDGIGEGADCIDGFVKVCQAGVCDCQKP